MGKRKEEGRREMRHWQREEKTGWAEFREGGQQGKNGQEGKEVGAVGQPKGRQT